MDIGSILVGVALVLVVAFVIARPLLEPAGVIDTPASPAEQLVANREQVLTQLRDLDFDHAMSKINDVDYAAQRAQLVAQGVALLKQLDALGVAPAGAGDTANAPAIATAIATANAAAPTTAPGAVDEIEAAVAQRRARRAAPVNAPGGPATPIKVGAGERLIAPAAAVDNLDAQIEASIAERRAGKPAGADRLAAAGPSAAPGLSSPADKVFCGQCGQEAQPGDRFCARCGAALPAPAAGRRPAKAQS